MYVHVRTSMLLEAIDDCVSLSYSQYSWYEKKQIAAITKIYNNNWILIGNNYFHGCDN